MSFLKKVRLKMIKATFPLLQINFQPRTNEREKGAFVVKIIHIYIKEGFGVLKTHSQTTIYSTLDLPLYIHLFM